MCFGFDQKLALVGKERRWNVNICGPWSYHEDLLIYIGKERKWIKPKIQTTLKSSGSWYFVSAFEQTPKPRINNSELCFKEKTWEKSTSPLATAVATAMKIQRKEREKQRMIWEREREREFTLSICLQLLLSARKNVLVRLWGGFMRRLTLWMLQRKRRKREEKCLVWLHYEYLFTLMIDVFSL